MDLLAAAALGLVQGLTEFLPISSSAHLILARAFFGWDAERFGLAFDVALHVGTLAAVLAFFRADVTGMVRAVPRVASSTPGPDGRRLQLVIAATLPIVVIGGLWNDAMAVATRTPLVAATALLLGAGLLLWIERLGGRGRDENGLSLAGAVLIGLAQGVALIPGVSRSGATIAMGMLLGLRRDVAARFAFLMSIPAIGAAAAKKGLELNAAGGLGDDLAAYLVGIVTSALVGYVTVKYFMRFLVANRLDVFAWYRVALAAVTFTWLVAR